MAEEWARTLYLSRAWVELRQRLILQRGPVCEQCGAVVADTSGLVGHHKVALTPQNVTDPTITLNPDNVELICLKCHNAKHKRFGHQVHKVYVIYGSPCSGKKELVGQLQNRGDLVVDMDRLYMAVSGCALYDKPDNLLRNVFQVRDVLLDNIKTRYGGWQDAYVIGGYPRRAEREELVQRLGAEAIYSGLTQAECMARAESMGVFAAEWKKYVAKWWKLYEPEPSPRGAIAKGENIRP
jgi:hypothetical protein